MIVNRGNLQTLNRAFSAAFREGYGQAMVDHEPITLSVPSSTRTQEYGWLGQVDSLREWVGERTLAGVAAHGYTIVNRKFERTVEVLADDIRDDQYGVYGPLMRELGEAAKAHMCELVYDTLVAGFWTACYDGQYLFDTDHDFGGRWSNVGTAATQAGIEAGTEHPWFLVCGSRMLKPIIFQRRRDYTFVTMDDLRDEHVFKRDAFRYGVDARVNAGYGLPQLAYGSVGPLDAGAYETARTQLLEAQGDAGRRMGVRPTHLIVPPHLEHEAMEILNAERLMNGATNVWRGTAKLLCTPWLP